MINWEAIEEFLMDRQADMSPDMFLEKYSHALVAVAVNSMSKDDSCKYDIRDISFLRFEEEDREIEVVMGED
jgi:hypothetical protein